MSPKEFSNQEIARTHDELGIPPPREEAMPTAEGKGLRLISRAIGIFLLGLIGFLATRLFLDSTITEVSQLVTHAVRDPMFWGAVAVGLLAQAVDGALGMAYGVTASSFLLAIGASPAMASGATHLAEVFTTGVSGISHQRLGHVNKRLFLNLLIPGVIGGLLGTYLLSSVDGKILKPYVSAYLLIMGLYVISRAFRRARIRSALSTRKVAGIAVLGGFMDSTGGGGWGPIVTTTLVSAGQDPRVSIGSVNYAEFFLTVAVAAALFSVLDQSIWLMVSGLVLGGVFAAPLAAYATRRLNARTLILLVGGLISLISVVNLYKSL